MKWAEVIGTSTGRSLRSTLAYSRDDLGHGYGGTQWERLCHFRGAVRPGSPDQARWYPRQLLCLPQPHGWSSLSVTFTLAVAVTPQGAPLRVAQFPHQLPLEFELYFLRFYVLGFSTKHPRWHPPRCAPHGEGSQDPAYSRTAHCSLL